MSLQYKTGGFANISVGDPNRDKDYYNKNAIVCQVSPGAKLPVRAHESDAGADLFCWMESWANNSPYFVHDVATVTSMLVIPPGKQMLVDTGIAMKIPVGYAGFVDVRSSQRNKGITSWGTGIIDSEYRGNIKVVLYNGSAGNYVIEKNDKIAQIVIQKVELPDFIDLWNDSDRGTGGFGSTGK